MDVGNKIKKYREKQGLSQDELAQRVFVSRQTVSNWETAKSYPDIKSLSLLSNIFDIGLDDFIKHDVEEMKRKIDTKKIKELNLLATIYFIELIVLIISAYPLFVFADKIGILVWLIFFFVTVVTAVVVERFKKHHDIQTYKEIIAFCEGEQLSHDEEQQELGKRFYQKILLGIIAGSITGVVILLMKFIFDIV